jgi:hypothetical protein
MKPDMNLRVSGTVPVEIRPRGSSWLGLLKDLAPIVTATAGVAVSLAVFYYGNKINERQLEITTREKEAAEASLRAQAIRELSHAPDGEVEIAAAALAEFGVQVLPAVWVFLSSSDTNVRNKGILTATKLYEGQPEEGRRAFLDQSLKHFDLPSSALKSGVLDVYSEVITFLPQKDIDAMLRRVEEYVRFLLSRPRRTRIELESLISANKFLQGVPSAALMLTEIAVAHIEEPSSNAYDRLRLMPMQLNGDSCKKIRTMLKNDKKMVAQAQDVFDHIRMNGYCPEENR